MSDLMGRLEAIDGRAEGLTDLCAEHLRQSIRHVQRNCDIDCNIHEDEATWDDCKQPGRGDGDRMAAVLADVTYLLTLARKQSAALEAVRAACDRIITNADGHKPPGPPNPTREQATAVRIRAALGDGDE